MALNFDDACMHPELRQEFIDGIDLEWARPHIASVEYVDASPMHGEWSRILMSVRPAFRSCIGFSKGKGRVKVFSSSFDQTVHQTRDDFCSSLIDHEGAHAQDMFEEPSLLTANIDTGLCREEKMIQTFLWLTSRFSYRIADALVRAQMKHEMERRANEHQLNSGRPLSLSYKQSTKDNLNYAEAQLRIVNRLIDQEREGCRNEFFTILEQYIAAMMKHGLE